MSVIGVTCVNNEYIFYYEGQEYLLTGKKNH